MILGIALAASPAFATSTRTLITPIGAAAGDFFGHSGSTAGDVNGDGYADVIVGAYLNDAGGGEAGQAYVYYGGPGADAVADLTLTGAAAGDGFGFSVSTTGDLDGDGYADVIVGAPFNDAGGVDAGRAYVYYGGPGADGNADRVLIGEAPGDEFGYSVSTAGDVNGDGYADVIVGAPFNDAAGANAGRAYVYYGGPAADAIADLTLTGAAAADFFGWSVSRAGDVSGDSYADVIVGAPLGDAGGVDAGQAYVYYGGPGVDAVADLVLTGEAAGDQFGFSVATAGTMNGDGYSGVIVGALHNGAGGANAGRAYVYYGGPAVDAFPDLTLTGAAAGDQFGISVSTAGDVNGDGFADVVVGANQNDASASNAGRAYVYYGGPTANAFADLTLTGAAAGDNFGVAVSTAGDLDGDGHVDVIVGAYENDAGGSDAGRAYVYSTSVRYQILSPNGGEQWVAGHPAIVRWLGADVADLALSADGGASWTTLVIGIGGSEENQVQVNVPATPTEFARVRINSTSQAVRYNNSDASDGNFSIVVPHDPPEAAARLQLTPTGAAAGDLFGVSASMAGDVNGDGFADVIVGAYLNDAGGANAGRAYVYYGGPGADAIPDLTLTGGAAGDQFGISVSTAGDMNGDGYADVIVGAPLSDAGGVDAGRAYVYYGGPGVDAVADLTLTGEAPEERGGEFGFSVSTAGDVNGDGYADVVVGAFLNDTFPNGGAGRAYVYYGGPGADTIADLTLTGEANGDQFGISVSTAGDVNGDGFADVVVGANQNAAAAPNAGRAYVYYGGPLADATPDLTFTGVVAGDNFGISVSTAGDVDGDGFADVIVGAYLSDAGGLDAGRAYIYYGGPGVDAVADLTLTGAGVGDWFGGAVGTAGDVNGDGYADVIVAANQNDAGGLNTGRAYVYYGGPGGDAVADLILTGEAVGDQFGAWVTTAGDINGDGFADLIVGAYGNDAGGVNAGRAYVYDMKRYHLLSPNGGETWNVGALKSISWLGAEPAEVLLSTDGGKSYELLRSDVGGEAENTIPLLVPHSPTKFARIRVAPNLSTLGGQDESDTMFTIQTSVALLALLAAPSPGKSGALISWQTDPGPTDLSGYRLERATRSSTWSTIVALTRDTSYEDMAAGPGSRYRLFAVNGLGEELMLGETAFRPAAALTAWPVPYRGGNLTISFATYGGLGGGAGTADVSLYDVSGRLVRTLARGTFPAGYQSAVWDGLDRGGHEVATGVYFIRSRGAGTARTLKVVIAR